MEGGRDDSWCGAVATTFDAARKSILTLHSQTFHCVGHGCLRLQRLNLERDSLDIGPHEDELLDKAPGPHEVFRHDFHSFHLTTLSHFLDVYHQFLLLPFQARSLPIQLANHLREGGRRKGASEGVKKGGRKRGREEGREEAREGGREGGRNGGRKKGGSKGEREEGGRKREREKREREGDRGSKGLRKYVIRGTMYLVQGSLILPQQLFWCLSATEQSGQRHLVLSHTSRYNPLGKNCTITSFHTLTFPAAYSSLSLSPPCMQGLIINPDPDDPEAPLG